MLERDLEKHLYKECKKRDLLCIKNITVKGFPDRMIIDNAGNVYFVELKRENGILSPAQRNIIDELHERKCLVYVLYGKNQVDDFLNRIIRSV